MNAIHYLQSKEDEPQGHINGCRKFKKNFVNQMQGHYIILKQSIQQENITLVNMYAPTTDAPT